MNLRPLFHTLVIFCFLILSSCTNNKLSSESSTRKDSAGFYFEKGKNSEEIQEKISNFNKTLQNVEYKTDTLIPDILDYKIYYHIKLKEYDSSLYFSDALVTTAKAQKDSNYIAKGYYRKSAIFNYLNQNEKVF